ncbi:MAG: PRC-barrel domain containing protein [Sphingomicrobium sp.]
MEQIAAYVAPAATLLAAFVVACNLGARITGWGFVVYTIGSVAWLTIGLTAGPSSLVWQNAILLPLNLFGIWRWLGRQSGIEDGAHAAMAKSRKLDSETLFPLSLLGKARLVGADEDTLGHCVDAMTGCRSGRIDYLVISDGGIAGVGETLRRFQWKDAHVHDRDIRTGLDRESFERLPELARDDWPGQ